jgi:hypothetical protein
MSYLRMYFDLIETRHVEPAIFSTSFLQSAVIGVVFPDHFVLSVGGSSCLLYVRLGIHELDRNMTDVQLFESYLLL